MKIFTETRKFPRKMNEKSKKTKYDINVIFLKLFFEVVYSLFYHFHFFWCFFKKKTGQVAFFVLKYKLYIWCLHVGLLSVAASVFLDSYRGMITPKVTFYQLRKMLKNRNNNG